MRTCFLLRSIKTSDFPEEKRNFFITSVKKKSFKPSKFLQEKGLQINWVFLSPNDVKESLLLLKLYLLLREVIHFKSLEEMVVRN